MECKEFWWQKIFLLDLESDVKMTINSDMERFLKF